MGEDPGGEKDPGGERPGWGNTRVGEYPDSSGKTRVGEERELF